MVCYISMMLILILEMNLRNVKTSWENKGVCKTIMWINGEKEKLYNFVLYSQRTHLDTLKIAWHAF